MTDMSREQMEAAGYGFHHQSDDGKYLIMGNGSRAFAIRNEEAQEHAAPEKMAVLVVEPRKEPYLKEIDPGLHSLQAEVGGDIAASYPFSDPVGLVCNDEGKLIGLELNRGLRDKDGNLYDIMAGIDYLREMQRRRDRELSFSDLPQMEMDKLCVVDHYPSDRFTFSSHGYDLHIENELVADAFAGLSVQEQSILILHFVLDLPDQEVGRLVGMSRSAVQRRRAKSLTELRIKLAALMPKGG